jgi:hypothetical protein
LELNTFTHASCALLVYLLWWDKPWDIEEPVYIAGQHVPPIISILEVREPMSGTFPAGATDASPFVFQWTSGATMDHIPSYFLEHSIPNLTPGYYFDDVIDLFCNQRLSEEKEHLYHTREGLTLLIAFTAAGAVYGALHLIAWSYPFTMPAVQLLWKVSGLVVAASGPTFLVVGLFLWVAGRAVFCLSSATQKKQRTKDYRTVVRITCYLYSFLYIMARAFLIVACFVTFPYLPAEVFHEPAWANMIPHIA